MSFNPDSVGELRRSLGLSQQRMAAELGVNQTTVSRWETGAQSPRGEALGQLYAMATVHGVRFNAFTRDDVCTCCGKPSTTPPAVPTAPTTAELTNRLATLAIEYSRRRLAGVRLKQGKKQQNEHWQKTPKNERIVENGMKAGAILNEIHMLSKGVKSDD